MTRSPTKNKEVIFSRGPWAPEEDRKLAEVIASHGAKRWKTIAAKAGLNRCGKSCRLRWLNYLRPNIKRGNISDQEEDLILRLHRLLGNRCNQYVANGDGGMSKKWNHPSNGYIHPSNGWSLIAGRLPGRTDNEIKNYWNSHLSKKINPKEKQNGGMKRERSEDDEKRRAEKVRKVEERSCNNNSRSEDSSSSNSSFNVDDFFDFSNEDPLNLDWVNQFLQLETAMS